MKDITLEMRLIAATPKNETGDRRFVSQTLSKLRDHGSQPEAKARRTWSWLTLKQNRGVFAATLVAAVIFAGFLTFVGYAYATGSDPATLIKRWINGQTIHVQHGQQEFTHGTDYHYDDMAVSAFAELQTLDDLAQKAQAQFGAPKNGVEYLGDPTAQGAYVAPYIATIKAGSSITLKPRYVIGDEELRSPLLSQHLAADPQNVQYFKRGEPAAITDGATVYVVTAKYLRHQLGSSALPAHVTVQFAFELRHDLENIKSADKHNVEGNNLPTEHQKLSPSYPSWVFSKGMVPCANNAGEQCTENAMVLPTARGLYGSEVTAGQRYSKGNPAALSYGYKDTFDPEMLVARNIQGRVTAIDETSISIKGSSGKVWKLAYNAAERQAFARQNNISLALGDTIAGTITQPLRALDGHEIDSRHIPMLVRLDDIQGQINLPQS